MGIASKSWGGGVLGTTLTSVLSVSSEAAVVPRLHLTSISPHFTGVRISVNDGSGLRDFCRLEIPPYGAARVTLPNLPDGSDVQALADRASAINYLPTGGSAT